MQYKLEACMARNKLCLSMQCSTVPTSHFSLNSAMTSTVVAHINMGLQFRGNWCNANKGGEFLKTSFNSSCNTNTFNSKRRFSQLVITASSQCSPEGMDTNTINGMKHVPLVHLTAGKLANEINTEQIVTLFRGRFVEDVQVNLYIGRLISLLGVTKLNLIKLSPWRH